MLDSKTLKSVIEEIEGEIQYLSFETRLCNPSLESIVYKYELRGSIEGAITKLKELKQAFVDGTYTDKMVNRIVNRVEDWDRGMCNNPSPYKEKIHNFFKSDDGRGYKTLQDRENLRVTKLHDKKECICFL